MSVSNGNLDSLLNLTFSVDGNEYAGGSIQSFTLTAAPSFVPTSVTVDTTGVPGAGAVGGANETFKVVGVHDSNNSLTLSYASGATVLGEVSEYVVGYTSNAILLAYNTPQQSFGEELSSGQNIDNEIAVLSTSSLAPGTTLDFTSDGTFTAPLCFLSGTLIATPSGQTPVQRLAVGDMVRTLGGQVRPIVWIGKGRVLAMRGRRTAATPVTVKKGALADNVPSSDLRVTKAHSLFIDGVLIPVEYLVNHRSIIWDDRAQEVAIYHIELETHDVIVANGAPAETYRDDGNRWLFQNANTGWANPPQEPCAPVLTGGPIVDAAWQRLLDRAGRPSRLPLTDDPDLHLDVDGKRVNATSRVGSAHIFSIPADAESVRIVSRAAIPCELGLARDFRQLGVALSGIVVRQGTRFYEVDLDGPDFVDGFHAYEPADKIRWTNGAATMPAALMTQFGSGLELILHVGGSTNYLDEGVRRDAA